MIAYQVYIIAEYVFRENKLVLATYEPMSKFPLHLIKGVSLTGDAEVCTPVPTRSSSRQLGLKPGRLPRLPLSKSIDLKPSRTRSCNPPVNI